MKYYLRTLNNYYNDTKIYALYKNNKNYKNINACDKEFLNFDDLIIFYKSYPKDIMLGTGDDCKDATKELLVLSEIWKQYKDMI